MRKRPARSKSEEEFIESAIAEKIDQKQFKKSPHKSMQWPIEETIVNPIMAEGSNLGKPLNISVKEYEWNTIDEHTKTIGIPKAVWIKHAMFKLLQEEQIYYSKIKDKK